MGHQRRKFVVLAVAAGVAAGACGGVSPRGSGGIASPSLTTNPASTAGPVPIDDHPVTLRLAVADPTGRQSEPAARYFVDRVAELSGGNVTIEATFAAGDDTPQGFELGVATLLQQGNVDLAMAASRVWDLAGVSSLAALQAPFLINNDKLALAVAQGTIGRRALDGMATSGLAGLAMWPEDLRHLFSFDRCGKDMRTPTGIAGATIVVLPSRASRDLIAALGGVEYTGDNRGADAEACRVQGMETGLVGVGMPVADAVATANVVLFPKYQVLAASRAALDRLTNRQRAVLLEAAGDTQTDAFTRQPSEADLGQRWCENGGSVDMASISQIAALLRAAVPVYDELTKDPLTRELIDDARALAESTQPSPAASACGPAATEPTELTDPTGFTAEAFPIGTYRVALDEATLLARGATAHFANINAGTWTISFDSEGWTASHRDSAIDEDCGGTHEGVDGQYRRMVTVGNGNCGFDYDMVWRSVEGGIDLKPINFTGWTQLQTISELAFFGEAVWTRID